MEYVHPTLTVSEGGVALGVLDAWMWSRQPKGKAEVLESLRWTEGYGRVAELAAGSGHAADYLVRPKHGRALEDGGPGAGRVAAGRQEAGRMAAADQRSGGDAGRGMPARGLVPHSLARRIVYKVEQAAPSH
jgi:hypothetical protein